MGVRNREEIKQALNLNMSQHERKRNIINKIEATKKKAVAEKDVVDLKDPMAKDTKIAEDGTVT